MSDKGNDNDKVKVSELLESEDVLPILYYRKEIMTAIKSNQIVIIVGETGSGKTTQLPQFIVDDKEFDNFKAIAVTQPRYSKCDSGFKSSYAYLMFIVGELLQQLWLLE